MEKLHSASCDFIIQLVAQYKDYRGANLPPTIESVIHGHLVYVWVPVLNEILTCHCIRYDFCNPFAVAVYKGTTIVSHIE